MQVIPLSVRDMTALTSTFREANYSSYKMWQTQYPVSLVCIIDNVDFILRFLVQQ